MPIFGRKLFDNVRSFGQKLGGNIRSFGQKATSFAQRAGNAIREAGDKYGHLIPEAVNFASQLAPQHAGKFQQIGGALNDVHKASHDRFFDMNDIPQNREPMLQRQR